MLYLLLKEDRYMSSIDHGYTYWKRVAEFEAKNYNEALSYVPVDKYGEFRLYEIRAAMVIEVKKSETYTLTEKEGIGAFSK